MYYLTSGKDCKFLFDIIFKAIFRHWILGFQNFQELEYFSLATLFYGFILYPISFFVFCLYNLELKTEFPWLQIWPPTCLRTLWNLRRYWLALLWPHCPNTSESKESRITLRSTCVKSNTANQKAHGNVELN
jgi:hypothetical protein